MVYLKSSKDNHKPSISYYRDQRIDSLDNLHSSIGKLSKKIRLKCLTALFEKPGTVRVSYCEPPWDQKSCS